LAEPDCINRAGRRGAFNRALRAEFRAGEVELLFARASEHARMELGDGATTTGGKRQHEERD
jgi:hypothetical protein